MEIVVISKQAYENLMKKLISIEKQLEKSVYSNQWLTNEKAMEILNVGRTTLQEYRNQGKIAFSQVGAKIYYQRKDIDEFLQKHRQRSFL